jgi:hypothetical protein
MEGQMHEPTASVPEFTEPDREPSTARLWAKFRRRWIVLQVVSWVLAWPLLTSLLLLATPRPDPLRTLAVGVMLFVVLPLWVTVIDVAAGFGITGGASGG